MQGRPISKGRAEGEVLLYEGPFSFLGGVDPSTGRLSGTDQRAITGKVFAFPVGKGSTVGSFTMLEMKRNGTLPAAIINSTAEPIVATGAVMCGVPLADRIDVSVLRDGDLAVVDGNDGTVEVKEVERKSVVTCIVRHKGRFLILKRSERVGTYRGKWAGVSGYVEKGEEPIQTALKEMREEVGLSDAKLMKQASVLTVRSGQTVWDIHPFLFEVGEERVVTDWEHTEHRWIAQSELLSFDTVPGFARVVETLLSSD